jgi:predicted transcriptional regulator of viral defense system
MNDRTPLDLGRREQQIMEAVYGLGQASVSEVLEALPDPPSYSAVRAILNNLEEKGHLRRVKSGKKFLYQTDGRPEERPALRAPAPGQHVFQRIHRPGGRFAPGNGRGQTV